MNKKKAIKIINKYLKQESFEIKEPEFEIEEYKNLLNFIRANTDILDDQDRARVLIQMLIGAGISFIGARIISTVILSPEPISKLSLLTTGGILLIAIGGMSILHSLGQQWQINIYPNRIQLQPFIRNENNGKSKRNIK